MPIKSSNNKNNKIYINGNTKFRLGWSGANQGFPAKTFEFDCNANILIKLGLNIWIFNGNLKLPTKNEMQFYK